METVGVTSNDAAGESRDEAAWPYASLLMFGYFGSGDAGGRQLARRTTAALALIAVGALGATDAFGAGIPRLAWGFMIPLGVLLIGWAYARYLGTLDELGRLIQLQAMAFAYFATMVLFFTAVALSMREPDAQLPMSTVLLVVFAEPLRGMALACLARRYR